MCSRRGGCRAQDPVEDTKGNNGDQGEMRITNLRLIWISKKTKRTNITIGYNAFTKVTIQEATSRLKGGPAVVSYHAHHAHHAHSMCARVARTACDGARRSATWGA